MTNKNKEALEHLYSVASKFEEFEEYKTPYAKYTIRNALQAQEWQPIETAPKDGTEILAGYFGKYGWEQQVCCWQEINNGGYWFWADKDYWIPTHWMPLPQPPKVKK